MSGVYHSHPPSGTIALIPVSTSDAPIAAGRNFTTGVFAATQKFTIVAAQPAKSSVHCVEAAMLQRYSAKLTYILANEWVVVVVNEVIRWSESGYPENCLFHKSRVPGPAVSKPA